ncbi:MAG: methylenetetrahydrofolate--tRNA-(uracil(54)-C(5))-methyltransferase (FADH(2)-oxidizing) TrmFO [Proteobacteria bacterium]|nr:MAG: methylenetetrahydrofolate--tRNA-(uracil(54)-C(5))-methyltransferase (FADH(2)-oxidizing) TrmFO [Pseudomonadota bacterium]
MTTKPLAQATIIGGGLAGCEAAWQLAKRGCPVRIYEMKPEKYSPAHQSEKLAELVCSNSFRSDDPHSAVGLLKNEMRTLNSLIMQIADETAVPAGKALAVDRAHFAEKISEIIGQHPLIELVRKEITEIPVPADCPIILASGPLTSTALAASLTRLTGKERCFFYDAIAPIINADSLDRAIIYQKSRYDDGPGDYLNCPMEKEDYLSFINELASAQYVPLHDFEDVNYFEGCLPIEVIRSRGDDTLRFGPMKPVGLENPATGRIPYAVVQLRKENRQGSLYNMVGFQTKLTYGEQKRIFRTIPGLKNATFARFGSIHRNTFICAPELLLPTLQTKARTDLFIAGQLSGVEGYVESTAMGLLAGINAACLMKSKQPYVFPQETAIGALIFHLTRTDASHFQPSNINFGLFPPWNKKVPKKIRGKIRAEQSNSTMNRMVSELNLDTL